MMYILVYLSSLLAAWPRHTRFSNFRLISYLIPSDGWSSRNSFTWTDISCCPELTPLSLGRILLLTHRSRSTNMATLFTSLRLLPTPSFHCCRAGIHAVHQRMSIYTPFGSHKPC
ncbi:hypothetical protein P389DRAFT_28079 [Cystobasidium minutum MCA 4210]|uniref:uncharacterized protein n=1 Tax=Cystobasidium minutum MCA 4210 TaxID=1397322 RepID=UPI0034CE8FF6|eukprot:jgi/Rhomi1/28079/CE28078_495